MTESDIYVHQGVLRAPEHLKVNDVIYIGGIRAVIVKIQTNAHDEIVLHLMNPNAITKHRSKLMLIIPKKIAIYIEKQFA